MWWNIFGHRSFYQPSSPQTRNQTSSGRGSPIAPSKRAVIFGIALIGAAAGQAAAQDQFVSFSNFLESTREASASTLLMRPDSKVIDASALEEMRQSILKRYEGVEVTHSFVVDGMYYDCVPIDQQPAVRNFGLKGTAAPPPQNLLPNNAEAKGKNIQSATQFDPEKPFDSFGNSVGCEAKTVPLLRTTLETLRHFRTLQQFYQKLPGGSIHAAQSGAVIPPAVASHKYSYTIQYVNNLGGNSNLNIWSPYVTTSSAEVFSLSQVWYIGGSGSGLQTEETGWVVYPGMFGGSEKPHFFIYSTAGNYAPGTGCWDNTCGDFVQVAGSGLLGATFTHSSSYGGTQYEFRARYYLYQGNWWLGYQGTWIGYYPGSKYHNGQNTRYAQILEFGSESVGTTIWPPEGSGHWSSTGFAHAAFQRNLYYTATSGTSYWVSLRAVDPSPACYSISGPYSSSGLWTRYFYEGGPGGKSC
jgi:neprosin-like protein